MLSVLGTPTTAAQTGIMTVNLPADHAHLRPSTPVSLATDYNKMASSRVSAHLPFYDSSKSSLAYGDRAIPKLVSKRLCGGFLSFGVSSPCVFHRGLPTSHALCFLSVQQNRELQSDDVRVRQQALLLLNDVIHRRENLAAALREGSYIHNGTSEFGTPLGQSHIKKCPLLEVM